MTKFKVFSEDLEDEKQKQRVILLQEVAVTSLKSNEGALPQKIVARRYGALRNDDQLEFLSTAHPREVELLPLVGERAYYSPQRSDHYTLNWACSFTGGVAEEDSPLEELESNWASRYGDSEGSNDGQESTPSRVVAWSTRPDYCSDLFTPECKKIHTILEVLKAIKTDNQDGSRKSYPPMLGAIRVKSKLLSTGDPDIANPFPFAFNAVVGKCHLKMLASG